LKKIAIIGCGPAGLSAAIALHDAGQHVSIHEQFDQPGPVGSGLMLQPTGLDVLQRWGIRQHAESLGQRIDGMLGKVAPDGKVVLDIQYRALGTKNGNVTYGVAIHRASLFHVLFDAVKPRGIPITTSSRIMTVACDPGRSNEPNVQLINEAGQRSDEKYDFVVDASGSYSLVANQLGRHKAPKELAYGALWTTVPLDETTFDPTLLEQRYDAAKVMVGVLPCGRLPNDEQPLATLFWSIRKDNYAAFKAAGLEQWKQAVRTQWPAVESLLKNINDTDQLTHASYVHHTMKTPYVPGVVYIGDAAHAASPQLGQGANMALLDAMALAQAVTVHSDIESIARLYARARRTHVRLFQAASTLLTPFYQSDNRILPAIRDTLFEPVTKLPFSAKLVASLGSGLLTNPVRTIDRVTNKRG